MTGSAPARLRLAFAALAAVSLACGPLDTAREILGRLPTPTPGAGSATHRLYFVATDGDDSNPCTEPDRPCRTIQGALRRGDADFVHIQVAPGVYFEEVSAWQAVYVDRNVSISGVGSGEVIIDAGGTRGGVAARRSAQLRLSNLTIQNANNRAPGSCVSVRDEASAHLERVVLRNCSPSGVEHISSGSVTLIDVTVTGATADDLGHRGIGVSSSGPLVVQGGLFADNGSYGISSSGTLRLEGATVRDNGLEGISVRGEAEIDGAHITGNNRDPELGHNHSGLQIQEGGRARVANSTLRENDYGIQVRAGGALTLLDSQVEDNRRSGLIIDEGGRAELVGATLRGNGAIYTGTDLGGGIHSRGTLTLTGSLVADNLASGLTVYGPGRATVRQTSIAGNREQGLFASPGTEVFLLASEVVGNLDDGGVHNHGVMVIEDSLISANGSLEPSYGVASSGQLNLLNSTISGNHSIGVSASPPGTLNMSYVTIVDNGQIGLNSHYADEAIGAITGALIARNTGRNDCLFRSAASAPTFRGGSLDSDGSCGSSTTYSIEALLLGDLEDNGGPTRTHALLPGSPAIEAASGSCPAADQRGVPRPQGPQCDVGAYEAEPVALSLPDVPPFATITPAAGEAGATTTSNAFCRQGPGTVYGTVTGFAPGVTLRVVGRSTTDPVWWQVLVPDSLARCWMSGSVLTLFGPTDVVPVIAPPPTPTATAQAAPTATPTPPAVPPSAPSGLHIAGQVCTGQDYTVTLGWTDTAGNETGYRVFRDGQLIATLGPNAQGFVDSPPYGGPYIYGVEAYNAAGASSRPTVQEPGCLA